MEEIKTLLLLVENHGLALLISVLAIVFLSKIFDLLVKYAADILKQKTSPAYRDSKIVKIECLLKTFFSQYLGELINSCPCVIRAGIFKVDAGKLKPYFTAQDLGYSQSLLNDYSSMLLENILQGDEASRLIFSQYGVKSLEVRPFDLNHGRYFLVIECTDEQMTTEVADVIEHQAIALEVLLRIYDDILGTIG